MTLAFAILAFTMFGYLLLLMLTIVLLGRRSDWMARPPMVDLIVTLLTLGPWIAGWLCGVRIAGHWLGGLVGLVVAVVVQLVALEVFHLVHTRLRSGEDLRINATLGKLYGSWQNRLGLWVTVPAVPAFLVVRLFECIGYYPLVVLIGLKNFRQADYITVSRHKIENLVGADLVWCLYCDWMTGQWSLGTQMLNQVESFWCPLAFADKDKCEKCAQFFDMTDWAPADASPEQMNTVLLTIRGNRPGATSDTPAAGVDQKTADASNHAPHP